jgi:hypothetical protein
MAEEEPPPERSNYQTDRWLRVRAQVERDRQGDHKVPTWVMALVLAAMIAAIVVFVAVAR